MIVAFDVKRADEVEAGDSILFLHYPLIDGKLQDMPVSGVESRTTDPENPDVRTMVFEGPADVLALTAESMVAVAVNGQPYS